MHIKLFFVALTACAVNGFGIPYRDEYARTPLGDSIDKASLKLLNEAYKAADNKNVVSSPLGVMTLLSLYYAGAGSQTKEQISQYLGVAPNEIPASFSDLSKRLANEDPSYLTMSNKVYISNRYTLADGFTTAAKTYESEFETVNFADPAAAAAIINKWSDEKTRGHIKEPVDADSLDPDTAACLVDVIFFQGHWHVPFEKSNTEDKDFHIDNTTTVKKPTMRLLQSLFYTENKELGARMIELPYKENGFRMIVVLPDEIDGLPKVLAKAMETGLMNDIVNLAPAGRDVNLELPKFDIKSKLNLNKILPEVGVSAIFSEGAPDIVKGDSVYVSKAFQEAFIKVDEEGATAGAFTVMGIMPTSLLLNPPAPLDFKVNRPFLYMIMYQDKILFLGTYTQ